MRTRYSEQRGHEAWSFHGGARGATERVSVRGVLMAEGRSGEGRVRNSGRCGSRRWELEHGLGLEGRKVAGEMIERVMVADGRWGRQAREREHDDLLASKRQKTR